jgi:hypothetical protein
MKCRTGDILIWRATTFHDILSSVTIQIKGLHTGLILVGDIFSQFSAYGKSPTNTYVTYYIDKVYPIEEVIGDIWVRANGSSLYHIQRTEGPDIDDDLALNVFEELRNARKLSKEHTIYISIIAYLKCAEIVPEINPDNKKQLCSTFIAYILQGFGLITENAVINNLLPIDFFNLEFYQTYPYQRIEIFDKGTHTIQSWFNAFFINFGFITPENIHHPIVESIMGNYDYPRRMTTSF